ncbi:MAG: signal peptidase I [Peptoniphilaceae bacterium]|nr:signal peptidase I [Peptoniphilaceae bacterium]MDY6085434.1 signal peptidase I [Peptoniphilaceae bacterium]
MQRAHAPESRETKPEREEFRPIEAIRIILSAILIAFLITHFLVSSTVVEGTSMLDTLHDGDRLFVLKQGIGVSDLSRGDIIVFHAPDENRDYIKRVVAFPGEYVQIENGMVYINGKRLEETYINADQTLTSGATDWLVPEGELFVLGDNRLEGASKDSRFFGTISEDAIVGRAAFRYFPFDRFGGI